MQEKIFYIKREELKTHPKNPRKGNVELIIQSIKENGFYGALVVQQATNIILAGNHRYIAGTEIGMEEFPVIFVDVDDRQALKILLADNKTSDDGTYDNNLLFELLEEFSIEEDLLGTGYEIADLKIFDLDVDLEDKVNDFELPSGKKDSCVECPKCGYEFEI